jgi:hypothetical protein
LDVVAELYGRVSSALTSDRSFPAGYRLADFAHVGAPLEERAAYQCSPLLVADVVTQALNGEGSVDWPRVKEVVLAPAEMISADVGRYQLYSRQGVLGSLASLDLDRARAQQAAQRATAAAQSLVELQQEWAALEATAQRLLAKGEAFQHLTLEMERGAKRDVTLDAARDGRADAQQGAPTLEASGHAPYGRAQYPGSAGVRIASQRGRAGYDARRRSSSQQRHWVPRSSWMRVSALVLTGGVLAVVVTLVAQWLRSTEHSVVAASPAQAVIEPEQDAEQAAKQPDVESERAALDTPPPNQ